MTLPIAPRIKITDTHDGNIELTDRHVRWAFQRWYEQQDTRYAVLRDYYLGHQRIDHKTSGARVCTNMCRYTVDSIVGYMAGNMITYTCGEGDTDAEAVIDLLKRQNSPQLDKEILTVMSIYGRAYRLVYHEDDARLTPKSAVLTPMQAFVCYTGTVEPESLFGAVVYHTHDERNQEKFYMDIYTATYVQRWESFTQSDRTDAWHPVEEPRPHKFGRVPLIEYKNAMDYLGDFEQILDLQDAYNSVMSDRQDDKDSFATAMMVVKGAVIGATSEELEEGKEFLKEKKIIQLDDDASIEYLTKQMNEADVQTFADALMRDMHKIAKVPNLSDESFASNSSGIAMLYKLYGTEMLAGDKEVNFQKGETRLFKLYDAGLHNDLGEANYHSSIDFGQMRAVFKYNVPVDTVYEANALSVLKGTGIVSDKTLREHCSIVTDPDKEQERIDQQTDDAMNREKMMYADEFARVGDE